MFSPQSDNNIFGITDPCNFTRRGVNATRDANCLSIGLAADFSAPTETTTTRILQGGNPNLAPEVANTWTIGAVLTPSFIPGLTATVDVLKAMAEGQGPREKMLALGYAGWGAGQLEIEIKKGSWLTCPPDDYLLFGPNLQGKWEYSIQKLGFNPSQLSRDTGRA